MLMFVIGYNFQSLSKTLLCQHNCPKDCQGVIHNPKLCHQNIIPCFAQPAFIYKFYSFQSRSSNQTYMNQRMS